MKWLIIALAAIVALANSSSRRGYLRGGSHTMRLTGPH